MLKDKFLLIFGVLLIVCGLLFVSQYYIDDKVNVAFDMMNKSLYQNELNNEIENNIEEQVETPEVSENVTVVEEPKEEVKNYYVGYLEIPRINFYRGFVDINSSANNISVNIEINKSSSYPDISKGNVIISAHSGTSYNAYFKYLYKLEEGDSAYVYYNNIKYIYVIDNIYNVPKVGKASIYRDKTKNTLTLVTCTYGDESSQTIYIAYLDRTEEY